MGAASTNLNQLGDWSPDLVTLFSDERRGFVRLSYLIVGDQAVAEELVQDAFVATAARQASVSNNHAYVRTAVVNRSRSWLRRQRVARSHQVSIEPEHSFMQPDELWDALGTLSERQRVAIVLRYYNDLRHAEIAEILDCSPVTVRTAIHRGLKQLKGEIQR